MKDLVEIHENYLLELLKHSTNAIKLYGSFNIFYQKVIHAHNFGVDLGIGEIITAKEITHLQVYEYLILSEGIFSRQIDMICFFLIKSGSEFKYREKCLTKINVTFSQIQEAYLKQKLGFLNDNGYSLFSKYFDRNLRNAIAHIDFNIDEEGNLIYKKQKMTLKELDDNNRNFMELIQCIHESFRSYYKEFNENIPDYSK